MIKSSQRGLLPEAGIKELPAEEPAAIVKHLVADLAATANGVSSTSGEKMDSDLSAAVAPSNSVLIANHGFKLVILADGKPGIEATITRPDGNQVTIQLCEGVRGERSEEIYNYGYGRKKLKGATLISHEDFVAVADSLLEAIKGFKVLDGVLQTEDEALIKAHQILEEGVRRDIGFSCAKFDSNDMGGVSGRRFGSGPYVWHEIDVHRDHCAGFLSPPAESK
jgi:hypothetical protein